MEFPILINVETVRLIRNLLDVNNAQNMLNSSGYYFDLLPYVEEKLKTTSAGNVSKGIVEYIKNNPVYFFTGDEAEVTRSINNYLMLDPHAISFFGYPIMIYSDPAHLRQYALYVAGAVALYFLLRDKRK